MSPTNRHQKWGNNLSQTISKTSNANKDKQNNNEFEEEMRQLKTTHAETINID